MIHAENGDMIQWLTGKYSRPVFSHWKTDIETEKLESKGMVGMVYQKQVHTVFY